MKVLKFGGSSVRDSDTITQVIAIVKEAAVNDKQLVVVVSAFQGVTDTLIAMAKGALRNVDEAKQQLCSLRQQHLDIARGLLSDINTVQPVIEEATQVIHSLLQGIQLVQELSPRTLDRIMSFGELLSSHIINETAKNTLVSSFFLDARQLIATDNAFGSATVDLATTSQNIRDRIEDKKGVFIVPGFIGSAPEGEVSTLGRGGSDLTASLIAAATNAEVLEIWTDVDGVMTADPHRVQQALPIKIMSYSEVMEMSHFGAKVLFPPTIAPAMHQRIPIVVKNTFNPQGDGTEINYTGNRNKGVTGISSMDHVALLRIEGSGMVGVHGFASRVFAAIAHRNINIIMITQCSSEHSICFVIKPEHSQSARQALETEFRLEMSLGHVDEIVINHDAAIIALVGKKMRGCIGVSGRLFSTLGKNGINILAIAQGSSELNVSCVIPRNDVSKGLNVVHEEFFLSKKRTVHLFLVGTGLIGTELIKQIKNQYQKVTKEQKVELLLAGLANSKKAYFDAKGIPLDTWDDLLANSEISMDLDSFITEMHSSNLRNSIFIDCTASQAVASTYERILRQHIAIVTPNKRACSASQREYEELKNLARFRTLGFHYEATVGAGLPILRTVRDLISSGDEVIRCEAVLSGTLSYLLNHFDGSLPFSELVCQAQEEGYTEPDPREDLNGLDFARKVLILMRECGFTTELEELNMQPLIPKEYFLSESVEAFLLRLKHYDEVMLGRVNDAKAHGKRLRYIARFGDCPTSISLDAVDDTHPFYSLQGSDNIIALTTTRCQQIPLVIKGPGAGAGVTAGEVLADVLRALNTQDLS